MRDRATSPKLGMVGFAAVGRRRPAQSASRSPNKLPVRGRVLSVSLPGLSLAVEDRRALDHQRFACGRLSWAGRSRRFVTHGQCALPTSRFTLLVEPESMRCALAFGGDTKRPTRRLGQAGVDGDGPNFENVRVIACTRTDADQATSSRRVASPSEQNPPRELHQCFPSPHQHTVRRSNPMQTL